jgi:hypothetical protein
MTAFNTRVEHGFRIRIPNGGLVVTLLFRRHALQWQQQGCR